MANQRFARFTAKAEIVFVFRPKQVGLGESSDSPHVECKICKSQSYRIGHGELSDSTVS